MGLCMPRLLISAAAVALLATTAFAADPVVLEPSVAAPSSAFDWSGLYVGHQGGWGLAGLDVDDGADLDQNIDLNGAFVGGILGYQRQWDWLVVGAEVEANWSDVDGREPASDAVGEAFGQIEVFGSAGVKLGLALDRFLIYGTGGLSGAEFEAGQRDGPASSDDHETSFGWMGGAGVDYGVTPNIIVGAQYRHYDFGDAEFLLGRPFTERNGDLDLDAISGHVTIKFGGFPSW